MDTFGERKCERCADRTGGVTEEESSEWAKTSELVWAQTETCWREHNCFICMQMNMNFLSPASWALRAGNLHIIFGYEFFLGGGYNDKNEDLLG